MITLEDAVPVEEASTIGLAPGHWPMSFRYNGTTYYRAEILIADDADLTHIGFTYVSLDRGPLKVLND